MIQHVLSTLSSGGKREKRRRGRKRGEGGMGRKNICENTLLSRIHNPFLLFPAFCS